MPEGSSRVRRDPSGINKNSANFPELKLLFLWPELVWLDQLKSKNKIDAAWTRQFRQDRSGKMKIFSILFR
uniref:Uncharacterized protein n=1 Tax=Rhizoctonia solani TaxID=456999 RepID=N0A542_9AGAM|nr:hypothetical protein RSOL_m00290 [Rhizoctonia solani]AGK45365.1 hypothetical protein RSOL_m00290 [Rhizoctonia solani]